MTFIYIWRHGNQCKEAAATGVPNKSRESFTLFFCKRFSLFYWKIFHTSIKKKKERKKKVEKEKKKKKVAT